MALALSLALALAPALVVAIARCDGTPKLEALRARVAAELLQFWPFRCVLDGGGKIGGQPPRWRELLEVDVSSLVSARTLPREADLDAYIGDSFALAWDWALPLWRVELLSFANAPRKSALLVRLNHCLADGVSMLKMFLSVFDGGRANAIDPPRRRRAERKAAPLACGPLDGALSFLPAALVPLARPPLNLARRFWVFVDGLFYGALVPLLPADAPTPLKLPSCQGSPGLSARRVATTGAPIPFAKVQQVKDAFGCTVNDVLVSCVAGAVRQHLLAQPGAKQSPALRRIRALFPANLRREGVDPLADLVSRTAR
ncbi:hypothetical protein T492DRAFT_836039 [Pavlovales sp. CCMP2436]|nr:hypothetical protein T492DRAFT_836039 [Pavlovales sp. CCMP2436]